MSANLLLFAVKCEVFRRDIAAVCVDVDALMLDA